MAEIGKYTVYEGNGVFSLNHRQIAIDSGRALRVRVPVTRKSYLLLGSSMTPVNLAQIEKETDNG